MGVLRSMDEVWIARDDHEPIHREILQLIHVKNIRIVPLKGIGADKEFARDEGCELKYSVKPFTKLLHQNRGFIGM